MFSARASAASSSAIAARASWICAVISAPSDAGSAAAVLEMPWALSAIDAAAASARSTASSSSAS